MKHQWRCYPAKYHTSCPSPSKVWTLALYPPPACSKRGFQLLMETWVTQPWVTHGWHSRGWYMGDTAMSMSRPSLMTSSCHFWNLCALEQQAINKRREDRTKWPHVYRKSRCKINAVLEFLKSWLLLAVKATSLFQNRWNGRSFHQRPDRMRLAFCIILDGEHGFKANYDSRANIRSASVVSPKKIPPSPTLVLNLAVNLALESWLLKSCWRSRLVEILFQG